NPGIPKRPHQCPANDRKIGDEDPLITETPAGANRLGQTVGGVVKRMPSLPAPHRRFRLRRLLQRTERLNGYLLFNALPKRALAAFSEPGMKPDHACGALETSGPAI